MHVSENLYIVSMYVSSGNFQNNLFYELKKKI